MSFLHTVRNVQRVRHIATVLIKHGFGQVIEKLDLEYRIFVKKFAKTSSEVHPQLSIAERSRMVLEELGPTFAKLGQVLSTRPDLLPASFIHELKKLQDQVPPISFHEISDQITISLGKTPDQLFSFFDPNPIASASIGQVHKAALRSTNEKVVVKVQRPSIRAIIESDLDLLYLLARLIEHSIQETQTYSPIGIIQEFDKAIHRELDYTIEAQNIIRFRHNFEHDHTVYAPKVYRELSTRNVLVIEFIEGTKISELDSTPEEKHRIARNGFRSILKQIFIDGFFHGDPHPGNLFVMKNQAIAFLDFGMMGRLDQEMKDELADLLVAVINQNVKQIAEILANIGTQTETINMRIFRNDVSDILDRYYGVPLHQIELGKVTREMMEVALKHKVKIPPDYTLMIKAMLTIESIGKQLDPNLNAIEEARPMVTRILRERWNPQRMASQSLVTFKNLTQIFTDIPSQLHQILDEMRNGKLRIEFEHVHLERLILVLDTASNRIAASLVLAALIIGSSIIMHANKGPMFMDFPLLGIIGFVSAGIIGFWLLLSIIRSGKF
ncbi:ubiquinone biosynthesis protein UbiB [Candidatus Vecturithrix granuli]|uniref:Ubiquinone biosynthesis protein UbiB n=1 Tax=Vecturithrix granuli TaxID=1499967 RepID=A0A081C6P6_VECG1|nr:ubiquinone biosynthesis protein UbiB [Candidatus Vecturithrix granuli]